MAEAPLERMDGESIADFALRRKRVYLLMANETRKRLKVLRNALRLGAIDDLELVRGNLREYEPLIERWPIERLLRACRHIGPSRSNDILDITRISPRTKVGKLSFAQRTEIARLIDETRTSYMP